MFVLGQNKFLLRTLASETKEGDLIDTLTLCPLPSRERGIPGEACLKVRIVSAVDINFPVEDYSGVL
jgi:hypothetical protein